MNEALLTGLTLTLGWLAYTLSLQRFYADLLDRRTESYHELLDTIERRETEARAEVNRRPGRAVPVAQPAQQDYFKAVRKARGLFGTEVHQEVRQYDQAFLRWLVALEHVQSDRLEETVDEYTIALSELHEVKEEIGKRVQPYIRLGRRGLPAFQRLKIGLDSWRRSRD